jgi:hypothetical protein
MFRIKVLLDGETFFACGGTLKLHLGKVSQFIDAVKVEEID